MHGWGETNTWTYFATWDSMTKVIAARQRWHLRLRQAEDRIMCFDVPARTHATCSYSQSIDLENLAANLLGILSLECSDREMVHPWSLPTPIIPDHNPDNYVYDYGELRDRHGFSTNEMHAIGFYDGECVWISVNRKSLCTDCQTWTKVEAGQFRSSWGHSAC